MRDTFSPNKMKSFSLKGISFGCTDSVFLCYLNFWSSVSEVKNRVPYMYLAKKQQKQQQ